MSSHPPCGDCAHPWDEHAPDINHPEALICWHLAATGQGCHDKYAERCKQYVPKT